MGVAILILIGLSAEVQSSARILSNVFVNGKKSLHNIESDASSICCSCTGEIVPYARQNSYGFQIPALSETPSGGTLAFAQAFVRKDGTRGHNQSTLQDGNDGLLNTMHSLRTFLAMYCNGTLSLHLLVQ